MQKNRLAAPCALLAMAGLACSALATNTIETEPNDNKAGANPIVGMVSGDTITGNTTGTSTTVAGTTSSDNFRIKTAPAALGIYRHNLTITTAGTAGHAGTIRGLNQTAAVAGVWDGVTVGTIGTTDTAFQTSSTATTPARANAWYGFGKEEEVYYRVTGGATTTVDFVSTLTSTPVAPITGPTSVLEGSVAISTIGQTTVDTDMWLYDSNFNPIVGGGNDDESTNGGGTGTTLQSRLVRSLTPGTYYLAISRFGIANNLASANDDDFRTGSVLDFPNAVACSSSTTTAADLDVSIGGNTVTVLGAATVGYDVQFIQFTVVPITFPTPPTGIGSSNPNSVNNCGTATSLLRVNVTPGLNPASTGITVTGNLSAIGGSSTQTFFDDGSNGDVTGGDNIFSYNATIANTTTAGAQSLAFTVADAELRSSNGNIALTVTQCPPPGDSCANPVVANLGSNPFTTTGAANDATTTCGGSGEDVFFVFTPATTGAHVFSVCGAGFDTVLALRSACATEITCDDDGCGDGLTSSITSNLTAGVPVIVQIDGFGGADGSGTLVISDSVPLGVAGTAVTGQEMTTVLLRATVSPGNPPPSTGVTVTGDLSGIGGSSTQTFYDDGSNGDVTIGDNIFSYSYSLPITVQSGAFSVPVAAADAQTRTANGTIAVTVTNGASGACCTAGSCSLTRETLCAAGGGTWQGNGSSCGYSYTFASSAGTFEDISTTGVELTAISNTDDGTTAQALPFTFNHLGNAYTSVNVSSNGNLQFGASNSTLFTNVAIPNAAVPNDMLAPAWDDYDLDEAGGGQGAVYYLDDSANGRVIFSWQNVSQFNVVPVDSNNFQVILYSSGNAEFRYGAMNNILNPSVAGDTVTIGYEDSAGASGGSLDPVSQVGAGSVAFTLNAQNVNPCGPSCDTIDFNNDGLFPDTMDIDDFLSVFSGGACSNDPNCGDIDYNNDGLFPDTLDIDAAPERLLRRPLPRVISTRTGSHSSPRARARGLFRGIDEVLTPAPGRVRSHTPQIVLNAQAPRTACVTLAPDRLCVRSP